MEYVILILLPGKYLPGKKYVGISTKFLKFWCFSLIYYNYTKIECKYVIITLQSISVQMASISLVAPVCLVARQLLAYGLGWTPGHVPITWGWFWVHARNTAWAKMDQKTENEKNAVGYFGHIFLRYGLKICLILRIKPNLK